MHHSEFHMSGVWRIVRLRLPMRSDPGQRRTHGQGVDQSTSSLQGVTQGRERESRRRSQREIGKQSLIIIVTVSHTLATQCHHQSVLALGVWRVTLCLSFPSIRLSLFQLIHTYTSTFSLSFAVACFISLCHGDFRHALFITALHHHRHSCQSSHTGPSPRLWNVLFSVPAPSLPIPFPGQGHVHVAAVKSSEKL